MRRNHAFTLAEIMIVVAIIALLAAIALPSFLRARQRSQQARFINALRIATSAFELYAVENNGFPPDALRGEVPPGMDSYLGPKFSWTTATPIGGSWDWDMNQFGTRAGVSVVGPTVDVQQMVEIDRQIDDGDLASGHFRDRGSGRYTDLIE